MSAELFKDMPFNLRGEELREEIDAEGQGRLDAENKANERKVQGTFDNWRLPHGCTTADWR